MTNTYTPEDVAASGNLAIGKDVLAAFKKLGGDGVVWLKNERAWRLRSERDKPGRTQEG